MQTAEQASAQLKPKLACDADAQEADHVGVPQPAQHHSLLYTGQGQRAEFDVEGERRSMNGRGCGGGGEEHEWLS